MFSAAYATDPRVKLDHSTEHLSRRTTKLQIGDSGRSAFWNGYECMYPDEKMRHGNGNSDTVRSKRRDFAITCTAFFRFGNNTSRFVLISSLPTLLTGIIGTRIGGEAALSGLAARRVTLKAEADPRERSWVHKYRRSKSHKFGNSRLRCYG
jgi:hypothetical protein